MSQREAARHFGISRATAFSKMLAFSVPPGYRRTAPIRRPKLDAFTGIIDRWLDEDRDRPRKQRHTAKRIFERLRDEHGFAGGYTIVKDYVREHGRRHREMFVPLAHAPGHAQADFGEAVVVIGGVEHKAHFFAMDLPHSDACFVRAYPAATTEAWWTVMSTPSRSSAACPLSILYDNDRCLVAKIEPDGTRRRTRLFSELLSHYLFRDRYGRPGKGNDKGKVEGLVGYCPAQLHGADPELRELGCLQRLARGAVPETPGGQAARARRDDRRTAPARSGGDVGAAGHAL